MSNPDNDEILASGKFLQLRRRGKWEIADRVATLQGVVIIAITENQELLMVEQFRVPVAQRVIEFPAGLVGDEADKIGEETIVAARRELEEETGYGGGEIKYLMAGPTSPGLTSEVISIFLATGLKKINDGGGVEGENITLHCVPLKELKIWLNKKIKSGIMIDPKLYLALHFVRDLP